MSDPWSEFRWLASPDERVLWATLVAALVMASWGAFVGRRRTSDKTAD